MDAIAKLLAESVLKADIFVDFCPAVLFGATGTGDLTRPMSERAISNGLHSSKPSLLVYSNINCSSRC